MADTSDGSSSAAQSAQHEPGPDKSDAKPKPIWDRLLSALSSAPAPNSSTALATSAEIVAPNGTQVGLGNLRRMRVQDVAVPRAEIVAVPSDIELEDLVETFKESGFSRLPVYSRTLDTPIGMIHLKDLAQRYGFNGKPDKFSLKGMLRPLLFAPPSMPLGVLLTKMQADRMHIALVVDEYGGTDGLVTIEDLIEQVVGEIEDEHDEPEDALWVREKPGCYLVQAKAPLDELEAELGIRLRPVDEDEEFDTLGGLVFLLSGRVPARGEVVTLENGTDFEIVDADPRRIKRIRVRLPGQADG